MFKKPIKLGGQNQLSGKDKKTIKNKLIAQFDPETVEKLFVDNDKIICNKISGSKMLIYISDEYPLFVDGTGKEEYFLSVYTGAAYEPLSKRLYINEGVEGFIFNGANLMWPGVKDLSRLGNFKKDQIVSIVNSSNEVIAIGAMGCSLDELKTNIDGSGIAVYILHYRGDKLWDLGSKAYPEVIVKAKEPKIEAKVEQEPVVQPKVQVKPAVPQSKPQKAEKGKGKKQQKEESDEEAPEEPIKQKAKGKKDKKVHQEQAQQPTKAKGKGKKQKKVDSEQQQPEQPVKVKGKGKKDKKVDSDEEKHQEPVKGKGKGKKEKKQQSDEQKNQEAPKGKGKGKKQTKQQKALPKKKAESEQSDNDIDFGNLVHDKKPARVQPPKAQKKAIIFSDQEDDKKGKKKGGRKGGNKKKQSDDDEAQAPKAKQEHKGKKHAEENDSDEEQVKVHQKKGKNKKQSSDDQEHEQEKVEKKKGKKDKRKKEDSDDEVEQQNKQEKGAKVEQGGQQQNQQGAKSAINGQLMDQYFKQAFLNVLKLSKVQAELPIDSGRFFSDYMILARPQGVKLQIKDTTYKKLGKFYEEMAKKKFIQFKPAKEKKGQQGSTITKIFWQNQQLKNYFPSIKKMGDKDVQEKVQQYSKEKLKLTKTLEVQYVYKLNEQLKRILLKKVINYMPDKSEDEQKEEKKQIFFSEKQLKQKIQKYINEIAQKDAKEPKESKEGKQTKQGKDKQKKSDKVVTLNYKQNVFIYNLLKRQIEQYEQNLEKEEMLAQHDSDQEQKKKGKKDKNKKSLFRIERGLIVNKIFKLASPHYNISDKSTGLSKFKQGTFKGIQLIADKVINKNVTKIIGIESFAPSNVEPEELVKQIHGFAHQLQVKFASSATVQNLPGKNAGKQIVVQGNFVDELETLFTTEFGIKKDYITIQNKLGKKKKN